jgi:TPP-dependent pyruvate/acetoin dehydrogenase alpha subunit
MSSTERVLNTVETAGSPEPSLDQLRWMYAMMVRIRIVEEKIAELVEAGEVGTPCHLYIGQEAIAAGVCSALEPADYVWGGHRSHGHYLAKGGDLNALMAEIYGKTTGCSGGRGGSMHLVSPETGFLGSVPLVAATVPLAVGAALAAKLRGEARVSVSFFGDGAVEEGHVHESANLAAVYQLPVIFVCENNFYSSHMQLLERRARDNIVEIAGAHGFPGVRIDGNDAAAVYRASAAAVARARRGGGPSLLECRTYRWRGHVGPSWDMDVGVKRKSELDEWMDKDPIRNLATILKDRDRSLNQQWFATIEREARIQVDESVQFARKAPSPDEGELTRHVY